MPVHQHSYDVVVVGAGGAGLRAALEASSRVRTAVVSKLHPTRAPIGGARSGIAAALANVAADDWRWHAADTVRRGAGLVDEDAAELMCREAAAAVLDLERLGLPFDRTPDGRIAQQVLDGHTRPEAAAPGGAAPAHRVATASGTGGHHLLQTLFQGCVRQGIAVFDEFHVLDLLVTDGRVAGVVAYELATGDMHVFAAKAVVLATGGLGRVFGATSNPYSVTGDGMALAFRRGVPLQDLEFVQFHPAGIAGRGVLLSETPGGVLRNGAGESFVGAGTTTPDEVSRAIVAEVQGGRGAGPLRDHVLLDLTALPELDGAVFDTAETYAGIDVATQPVPVYPTAHYAMGGVATTVSGEALDAHQRVVAGLYAAGEVACVSVHGASRLVANGLLDVLVFGRRAGIAAAEYAAGAPAPQLPDDPSAAAVALVSSLLGSVGDERVSVLRRELNASMDRNAGVVRTGASLAQAAADLAALRQRYAQVSLGDRSRVFNTDLTEAVELGFLLDLAEVIVAAAGARTESRGAHFRADHPGADDAVAHHSVAHRQPDGSVRVGERPVTRTAAEATP